MRIYEWITGRGMSRETANSVLDLAEGGTLRGPPLEPIVRACQTPQYEAMFDASLNDPAGYGTALSSARLTLNDLEHLCAMVAAGQKAQLPAATDAAHRFVIHARSIAAWCDRQRWELPGQERAREAAMDLQAPEGRP